MIVVLSAIFAVVVGAVLAWTVLQKRLASEQLAKTEALKQVAVLQAEAVMLNNRLEELRASVTERESALATQRHENAAQNAEISKLATGLAEEKKAAAEKIALLTDAQDKLEKIFKALSADALAANNRSFLDLAKENLQKFQEGAKTDLDSRQKAIDELVKPLQESLKEVDKKVQELEVKREGAYSAIAEQINALVTTQSQLRGETTNLVKALRTPQGRGRWGEVQLRRVVEMAGMVEHCDFIEQPTVDTGNGRLRPDMIVMLPGNRTIVVDAKTPLSAYLDSLETVDDEKKAEFIRKHARQVKDHIDQLSAKNYSDQFEQSPELVVMFLEAESIFSGALQGDSSLIEYGGQKKIVVATPTTLIALLRAVSYGWTQVKLEENAKRISKLGQDLYDRIATFTTHVKSVGSGLKSAVENYNDAVGSLEARVLPSARKFKELDVPAKAEINELKAIEVGVRKLDHEDFPQNLPLGSLNSSVTLDK